MTVVVVVDVVVVVVVVVVDVVVVVVDGLTDALASVEITDLRNTGTSVKSFAFVI